MASDTASQVSSLTGDSSDIPAASSSLGESRSQELNNTNNLPAVLSRRDLTALMLLIVLFVANNNGVQFVGPAAFFYWVLGLLTFLIPCSYITQWLAQRFPGQGAPYIWALHIIGPKWSFFSAFCAWVPGILAVVSAIEAAIIFVQYLVPTWFTTPFEQGVAIVLVLVIPTGLACLPLRLLKHILLLVAILYTSVFMLLGIAGFLWLWQGHAAAVALNVPATWKPSGGNFAVYGLIILALLGADIPIFMGGEIRGGNNMIKHASSYVWWGTVIVFIAYVVGTFGIMVVVPPAQAGVIAANVQAIQMVFGSTAGNAVSIVLAIGQVALTIAYILIFSRLLVVVAQDGRLPTALAKINRHGVPVLSIVIQGALVALVTILSLVIVPAFFGTLIRPDDLAFAIYNVLQAGTTVVWVCSIVQLFSFVLWILFKHKKLLEVPGRQRIFLILMSLLGTMASLVGIWATISSSWLPSIIPNTKWAILVLSVAVIASMIGWIGSELPRAHALLSEQKRLNKREIGLREELQSAYNEQKVLVQQQQVLLAEVDRLYREQAKAAVTDAITNLPNHRAVMNRIDEELSRCQRTQSSCAILFVDLDHFKRVNDTWGHRAGDAILREVASRLCANVRLEDFVGRYGGEEFAVLLTVADLHAAQESAERLRKAIASEPCNWETEENQEIIPITITASIGVAVFQLHGITREALIELADSAMYRAKRAGRNRVCIAEIGLLDALEEQSEYDEQSQSTEFVAMQALTAAASARDRSTNTHSHRIVKLAVATGQILELAEGDLHLLRLAALLHDIGKIGIPDAILNKPGPLTDDEWEVMRSHPEIGRDILEQAGGVFCKIGAIVEGHHERWDGSGYPLGLAKEAISICSRILSVVDAYDAMISQRPYKQALTINEAKAELIRCAGSQFDPLVVKAFLRILDEQEPASPGNTFTQLTLPDEVRAVNRDTEIADQQHALA